MQSIVLRQHAGSPCVELKAILDERRRAIIGSTLVEDGRMRRGEECNSVYSRNHTIVHVRSSQREPLGQSQTFGSVDLNNKKHQISKIFRARAQPR
jgi:hypothetical protein